MTGASQATGLGSAKAPEPHLGLSPAGAIPRAAGGFGGRTFSADGRLIRAEPQEVRKEDGRSNISLGFPFATLEEYVDPPSIATDLAEYLSCPKRAAAPELYALLAILEWGDDERPGCPFCGMGKETGHLERCQLNDALAAARGEQP